MKKSARLIVSVVSIGMIGWVAWAHEDPANMPARSESKEFQFMKQLVGTWQGTSTMEKDAKPEPVTTVFKLTSAGSVIEETLMPGTPHEMVDMYTDEDGKLTMTHYCAMGNHPHMVLKQSGPSQISLVMGTTPGINASKDLHMHGLTLELANANHLTEQWTSYENGKAGESSVFTFSKVH